jgi:hypothetical protein
VPVFGPAKTRLFNHLAAVGAPSVDQLEYWLTPTNRYRDIRGGKLLTSTNKSSF